MLRQLAQSQFLGLFDDDEKKSGATAPSRPHPEAPPDEDADLRLHRTMPLTPQSLAPVSQALAKTPLASAEGLETVHTLLCAAREAGAFQRAATSGELLLVACTQESRLFLALAEQTEGALSLAERPIRFVNIRESGGWSKDAQDRRAEDGARCSPPRKLPTPSRCRVATARRGCCRVVIGGADAAAACRRRDAGRQPLERALLLDRGAAARCRRCASRPCRLAWLTRLTGWLGAFKAEWESSNPIDL